MSSDPIDDMLKRENPYLDDAGFTQRVMQALPPPRPSTSRARGFVLAGSAAAAGLVAVLGPVRLGAEQLASAPFAWPSLGIAMLSMVVVAVTALSVALRELEQ